MSRSLAIKFEIRGNKEFKISPEQVRKASTFLLCHSHSLQTFLCCFYNVLGAFGPKIKFLLNDIEERDRVFEHFDMDIFAYTSEWPNTQGKTLFRC